MTGFRLSIVAAALIGAALAVGAYTFVYAKGAAYLTNDPNACANCHVMGQHLSAWVKGSHHAVATCNDCHTPHNIVLKYMTKAENGFRHSLGFTTGRFPDPLRITDRDYRITEHACRKCHTEITAAIDVSSSSGRPVSVTGSGEGGVPKENEELQCVRCHRSVGHWVR